MRVVHSDWRYFGQELPGQKPKLFSPKIISTSRNERDFAISPSGSEIFYSYVLPGYNLSVIVTLKHDGAFWSESHIASFSGIYSDLEPAFSPDGNKICFISKRPTGPDDMTDDWNIWVCSKTGIKWGVPSPFGPPVNTDKDEYYPSLAKNGNLYFTAERDDSFGGEDIYFSRFEDGSYTEPVNLGESINTKHGEFNAYISPDEDYLIFSSFGREDEVGGGDLYISVKDKQGNWQSALNLGTSINSDKLDYCPFVTSDQKYLFFTSQRVSRQFKGASRKSLSQVIEMDNSILNGLGNIFWVSFDINKWKKD